MGYIDAQGRPEIVAQPFVKMGTAQPRVVSKTENDTANEGESDKKEVEDDTQ